ncbi:hypothetical protein GCM10011611_61080 [Aliidongia dinghuensis]|uniref:SMODS and SLOG-associating 2TM effector domain-containing protein n=1 Tax=Aliidongia dinghuensis TaxID=1867774 RepID=A0A8J2Z0B5_9PROT|nr:hypothetical protein [Aliidongia dinghuensis]GGF46387.1 hypothetical protein GCM10011611_61080 [Aliidongia dinghuensis]
MSDRDDQASSRFIDELSNDDLVADIKDVGPEFSYYVPLIRIRQISGVAQEKRLLCLKKYRARSKKKKQVQLATGILSLISGGATSALFLPAMDLVGTKLFAALVAFSSGLIALISHTYLDEKETAKLNEAADAYAELRARADIFLEGSQRNFEKIDLVLRNLVQRQAEVQRKFDSLMDTEVIERIAREILDESRDRARQEIADIMRRAKRKPKSRIKLKAIADSSALRPNVIDDSNELKPNVFDYLDAMKPNAVEDSDGLKPNAVDNSDGRLT